MLLGDFFEINQFDNKESDSLTAKIRFNKKHRIFQGHFPGFPVVPGVCMIQLVKEIIAFKYKSPLFLSHGDNIKFLRFIDPNNVDFVVVHVRMKEFQDGQVKAEATIFKGDCNFLKFKGTFRKET